MAVTTKPGSMLLLEELFAQEDPRFLAEIVAFRQPAETTKQGQGKHTWELPKRRGPFAATRLGALGEKWARDTRPWARHMLLRWIDETAGGAPGQRPLVKHVFKSAEAAGDAEVIAAFLVAFDRLFRYSLKRARRWDWQTSTTREVAILTRTKTPGADPVRAPIFSSHTRAHLRRRALRFFRVMGRRDPAAFRRWVFDALARYDDAHVGKPEDLVASWSLMQLLHHGSDAIALSPRRTTIVHGRSLKDLRPSPLHPEAWRDLDALLSLLVRARSLYVRRQVAAFLEQEMKSELESLSITTLRPLLACPHADVIELASRLFANARGIESLSMSEWDALLAIDHPALTATLATSMRAHVSPSRVDLATCARWACASAAPIAELGLAWAKDKGVKDAAALETALPIVQAPVGTVRGEALEWLMPLVIGIGETRHLRDLLDSRFDDVRARALDVLAGTVRFRDEPELWAALAETPHPDARERLITHLEARSSALAPQSLRHVWATTLLAVHRGSRAKRAALRQIAARIAQGEHEADALLPLLAITLRSVRETERRGAIVALVRSAIASPTVRDAVRVHVPSLVIE
ncbi:hypothetical protein [Sandaracinus amylolyticus]|uniref:hypothetical protein n=1 Tax=Sandaracinus amylolyticus TaxID=927083 RepID=UPI001F2D8969|nr:hypothetical protein [Sandaracinus amylolyticus]UJR78275.1 Hypothetical protein I5071_3020 [Sandaracinus amylolyticus]